MLPSQSFQLHHRTGQYSLTEHSSSGAWPWLNRFLPIDAGSIWLVFNHNHEFLVPFGNNCTHNRHKLHSLSLVQLLCLLLVQLFPNHTQIHVITYTNWEEWYSMCPVGRKFKLSVLMGLVSPGPCGKLMFRTNISKIKKNIQTNNNNNNNNNNFRERVRPTFMSLPSCKNFLPGASMPGIHCPVRLFWIASIFLKLSCWRMCSLMCVATAAIWAEAAVVAWIEWAVGREKRPRKSEW